MRRLKEATGAMHTLFVHTKSSFKCFFITFFLKYFKVNSEWKISNVSRNKYYNYPQPDFILKFLIVGLSMTISQCLVRPWARNQIFWLNFMSIRFFRKKFWTDFNEYWKWLCFVFRKNMKYKNVYLLKGLPFSFAKKFYHLVLFQCGKNMLKLNRVWLISFFFTERWQLINSKK